MEGICDLTIDFADQTDLVSFVFLTYTALKASFITLSCRRTQLHFNATYLKLTKFLIFVGNWGFWVGFPMG